MFANYRLAFSAAEMEVREAQARLKAQNQLAAAQSQVRPLSPAADSLYPWSQSWTATE